MKIKSQFEKPVLQLYTINKQWVCNLTNQNLKNSVFSIKKILKINEIKTLTFSIAFDNQYLTLDSCEYLIKHEFDWYIIKNISLNSSDVRVLDITCESEHTILKTILCSGIEVIGATAEEMFTAILQSIVDVNISYIFETDITNNRSLIVEEERSVFENIVEMAKSFNATVEFSHDRDGNKKIFFRKNAHQRGKYIKRGRDLKQLNINYDSSALFTRIQPFGEVDSETGQELNIMDVNPTGKSYLENYSYYINKGMTLEEIKNNPQCVAISVKRFSDIVDADYLMTVAKEELDKISKPRIKGSVDYTDLGVMEDSTILPPIIFEEMKIIDKDIGMIFTSNIVGIEVDYDNILQSKITLDNVVEYKSIFKDLVTNAEKVDKITGTDSNTGKPTLIGGLVQGKINSAIASFGSMIDSIEKPLDTYAVLFECKIEGHDLYGACALGTEGLLIAKELNPDGTWLWKTAINANGIYGTEVVALTIIGEQIIGGVVRSVDNSSWINLENGEFNFKDKIKFVNDIFTIDLSSQGFVTDDDLADLESKVQGNIDEVFNATNNLENTMNGAFKDGILTETEKATIRANVKVLQSEKSEVSEEYKVLYNNVDLVGDAKSELLLAYNNYSSACDDLINYIDILLKKTEIVESDRSKLATKFTAHDDCLKVYKEKVTKAFDSIVEKKKQDGLLYTNEKVAELKVSLDGISMEVSSVETKLNETNKNVANLTIKANSIESTVSSHTNTITKQGNKITNAESSIIQQANQIATKVDVNGVKSTIEQNPSSVKIGFNGINDKFEVTATRVNMKASNGKNGLSFVGGVMETHRTDTGSKVGQIGTHSWVGTSSYGTSLNSEYGGYASLGYKKLSSDSQYTSMVCANPVTLGVFSSGVNIGANMHLNQWNIDEVDNLWVNDIRSTGFLGLEPDLNHWSGSPSSSTDASKDINVWTSFNMQGWYIKDSSFKSVGSIEMAVDYNGNEPIPMNLQEPESIKVMQSIDDIVSDVGNGQIVNGICRIEMPSILKRIRNIEKEYEVFISKYGRGDIWVNEKHNDYFVVEAENDIKFAYEIKIHKYNAPKSEVAREVKKETIKNKEEYEMACQSLYYKEGFGMDKNIDAYKKVRIVRSNL